MSTAFDISALLAAFDEIGMAARTAGARLEFAFYGGSALMLASNFRFASEDVDIAALAEPWPEWLNAVAVAIAHRESWGADWLNDAVTFRLSARATLSADHRLFAAFPRDGGAPGLDIYVPAARYMLALKLKAMRVLDRLRGEQEILDILNLLRVLKVQSPEEVVAIMGEYFPVSAAAPEKQLFLPRQFWVKSGGLDAPSYPT